MPILDVNAVIEERVNALREYHTKVGIPRATVMMSGGVDSAVILGVAVRAVGAENVTAAYIDIHSSADSKARAEEGAKTFGVKLACPKATRPFEALFIEMMQSLGDAGYNVEEIKERIARDPTILGSFRSCFRAPMAREFGRLTGNSIVYGTGNECEDRWIRFFQKGGDGEVDINPIEMFSKGEVFQLAVGLGVCRSILLARPSPDLWGEGEGHNDEDEITSFVRFNPRDYGMTWYSYVNPDTGEYKNVGLIERISRFLDIFQTKPLAEDGYSDTALWAQMESSEFFNAVSRVGDWRNPCGLPKEVFPTLLSHVCRVERITRHKYNPAIPALGARWKMVRDGLLTNTLPVL